MILRTEHTSSWYVIQKYWTRTYSLWNYLYIRISSFNRMPGMLSYASHSLFTWMSIFCVLYYGSWVCSSQYLCGKHLVTTFMAVIKYWSFFTISVKSTWGVISRICSYELWWISAKDGKVFIIYAPFSFFSTSKQKKSCFRICMCVGSERSVESK